VESQVQAPTFDSQSAGLMDPVVGAPSLEVVSSLSPDGRTLYVIGINKDFDSPIEAAIAFKEFRPAATANAWVLNGASIDANTGTRIVEVPGLRLPTPAQDSQYPRFQRGAPSEVSLSEAHVAGVSERFTYSFPAHSVTSLAFERAGDRPR